VSFEKEPMIFRVWPSVGRIRKWSVTKGFVVSGAFNEDDAFSLSGDCIAADNAGFDESWDGWRIATPDEEDLIALEWDEDTAHNLSD
jgi:hypothetical protein